MTEIRDVKVNILLVLMNNLLLLVGEGDYSFILLLSFAFPVLFMHYFFV